MHNEGFAETQGTGVSQIRWYCATAKDEMQTSNEKQTTHAKVDCRITSILLSRVEEKHEVLRATGWNRTVSMQTNESIIPDTHRDPS
jgi:hypothetical protein